MLFLALVFATGLWLAPQARAELMINEVLGDPNRDWDGDGQVSYRGDEWIEVMNNGPETVDLTTYYLRDIYQDNLHLQLFGVLEPGEVAVFYGSDAEAWQHEQGQFITGFSINNTGDTLELVQILPGVSGPAWTLIDRVVLTNHEVEDDRSGGWNPETDVWALFDAWNPYHGTQIPLSTECLPSPGEPNTCQLLVPVESASWDLLKSRYR